VIFGSSFAGDMEYQHLCRNINRVKLCMETGKTWVLLNLRSLYESLYELLNQYYMKMGDHKYVEIGLGVHRVKCRVHDDFRLVVIAAEQVVKREFAIPLLNRLEKHVLSTAGVLQAEANADANAAVAAVRTWARAFVSAQDGDPELALRDAFVGYSKDLISAIVFQQLKNGHSRAELISQTKDKLLMLATPDAVLRVAYSTIAQQESEIKTKYFVETPHGRLRQYVSAIESPLTTCTTHEHPVPSLAAVVHEATCSTMPATAAIAARRRSRAGNRSSGPLDDACLRRYAFTGWISFVHAAACGSPAGSFPHTPSNCFTTDLTDASCAPLARQRFNCVTTLVSARSSRRTMTSDLMFSEPPPSSRGRATGERWYSYSRSSPPSASTPGVPRKTRVEEPYVFWPLP
jgi:hypothetical protein